MATCNNCGHAQSDFLSAADIENIQLQTILLQERVQKMESESASLKAMLKNQSDQHQERVKELLKDFEAERDDYMRKSSCTSNAESLRRENEILHSSVFELNLKLQSKDEAYQAVKAELHETLDEIGRNKDQLNYLQAMLTAASRDHEKRLKDKDDALQAVKAELHETLDELGRNKDQHNYIHSLLTAASRDHEKRLKDKNDALQAVKADLLESLAEGERKNEILKTNNEYLQALEFELVAALERADKFEEKTFARNNVVEDGAQKDMMLKMQLEKSFGTSMEKIKKAFEAPIDDESMVSSSGESCSLDSREIPSTSRSDDKLSQTLVNMLKEIDERYSSLSIKSPVERMPIDRVPSAESSYDLSFSSIPDSYQNKQVSSMTDMLNEIVSDLSSNVSPSRKMPTNRVPSVDSSSDRSVDAPINCNESPPAMPKKEEKPSNGTATAEEKPSNGSATAEEKPSNGTATTDDDSDVEVIEMTDEILDLVF